MGEGEAGKTRETGNQRMFKRIFAAVMALAILLPTAETSAAEPAGRIERQKGEASRTASGARAPLAENAAVLVGDLIETGPGARLSTRFADDSSLTLGENARVIVDELIYAPAGVGTGRAEQIIKVAKGVFRFVSGRIGQANPNAFAFVTPVATIGIRGTDFVGGELTVGMPPGQPHYGFQIRSGAIAVTSPLGSALLDQPGLGTFLPLTQTAAPTPVRQWTAEEAAEADALLAY